MMLRDTKDLLIVSQLRENARAPVHHISRAVKLCRATVTEKVKELQSNIIRQYTCLVDFHALGYGLRLSFILTLAEEDKLIFCRYIQQHPCANNLYIVNYVDQLRIDTILNKTRDGSDYLVEMVFRNNTEADRFLSSLQNAFTILHLHVFIIEHDVLRESFLQNPRRYLGMERS